MVNRILSTTIIVAVVSILILNPAVSADEKLDPVIATVDGEKILQSHIDMFRASLPPEAQALPKQTLMPMIITSLVENKLVAADARRKGMDKTKLFKSQIARIEAELLQSHYMKAFMTEKLTEDLMQKHYQDLVAEALNSDEVRARHILLKTEAIALEVIAALDKGGDFVALAKEKSIGPSGPNGGDLGYFKAKAMVAPFSKAAFKMKNGEYTKKAVKTQFGWHVILVIDRRKGAAPSLDESRDTLVQQISQDLRTKLVRELSAKAKVEILGSSGLDKALQTK